jgi:L-ascorbate metabolism protein UlaG (beta-lactamase superfamily)
MMDIRWYGHASFRLRPEVGPVVITDPYLPELVGYAPIPDPADVVVISSTDDDGHCREDLVPGRHAVVDALDVARNGGRRAVSGLDVEAIEAMEYEHHTEHEVPGQNAMYRFELDGMKIAHMGDVGNRLTAAQMAFFEDVDLLLALTGDALTIKLPDLMEMIHRMRPRLVIPMHFRTLAYKPQRGAWIEAFLAHFHDDQIDYALGCDVTLSKADIPAETRVLAMDYHRPPAEPEAGAAARGEP